MSNDHEIAGAFLAEARDQMRNCHRKIRHCIEQLDDRQLWQRAGEEFNSIANLLLHLDGNISQRILSLIGGEPDTRNRDREFSARDTVGKGELLAHFDETIRKSDLLLASMPPERLLETRRYPMLRGEVEGTFVVLILHTLVHLGGHTQEIVALTRLQLRDQYRFLQTPA